MASFDIRYREDTGSLSRSPAVTGRAGELPPTAQFRGSGRRVWLGLLVVVWVATAGGCAWLRAHGDETKDWSASKLYSEAQASLNDGDYEQAIKYFESLEARYPFGPYAQQALLEMAYAYYKSDEPDSAIGSADRFIKTYPTHPHVDYAYYLKGLVNYNRGLGFMERYLPTDLSQRDPGTMEESFRDFAELVRKFPDSKYAADARQRMLYLRNMLAQHELDVATYYMRRGAFVAAAGRGKYIVEHYPRTPAVPEALGIMAKAYKILGLDSLSADAFRVLKENYPNDPIVRQVERTVVR
jgi:outer membrane protein assembly factor BamD